MSVDFPPLRAGGTQRRSLVGPLLAATVLGLLASELFVAIGPVETGLFGYVVVLTVGAVAGTSAPERRLLLIPATVASWRLVIVGAPAVAGVPPVVLAYLGALLAVFLLLESGAVTTEDAPPSFSRGLGGGVAGLCIGVPVALLLGGAGTSFGVPGNLADAASLVAVLPLFTVVDELLFRRLLHPSIRETVGRTSALVGVTLLYAVVAPATGQFATVPLALGVGAVLGVTYEVTRDVEVVVGLHAGVLAALVVLPGLL